MTLRKITRCAPLLLLFALAVFAQRGGLPDPLGREDMKLPNGKSTKELIIKADHKKNQEDAVALASLGEEVREELMAQESGVVSAKMIKKLDDIEKLSRGIRNRLKRF